MFRSLLLLLTLLLPCSPLLADSTKSSEQLGKTEQSAKKVKVLLITGVEYPGHPWKETAPQIAAQLASCPQIEVVLEPDFNVLCRRDIFNYDVLFLNFKNYDPLENDELALDHLEEFVQKGGGLVVFHFAIGMFENHKDRVAQILGRSYDPTLPPHDPYGKFIVRCNTEHPMTQNIGSFRIADELYTCLGIGTEPIEVIAESTSKVTKQPTSMGHLYKRGKGQVFTTVLGHDRKSLECEGFTTLLRNAVLWVGNAEIPKEPSPVVPPVPPLP
ncbi:MAG: ThuA domain-containing protein [Thermoguttaceae bacterium]